MGLDYYIRLPEFIVEFLFRFFETLECVLCFFASHEPKWTCTISLDVFNYGPSWF
jgi:hypothetical protein